MQKVYVVSSHVEVEIENWSSQVVKVFTKESDAQAFAGVLKAQAEYNETIEVETIELIGD
jgi:hypothetical protein